MTSGLYRAPGSWTTAREASSATLADGPSVQSARRQSGDGAAGRDRALTRPGEQGLRRRQVTGVAERGRAHQVGRELRGLGLHVAQALDVALEVVQLPHYVGHSVLLQQLLQPGGSVAFALPAHDRRADLRTPRVHLLGDGGVDLREEIGELVDSGTGDSGTGGTVGPSRRRRCRLGRFRGRARTPLLDRLAVPLSRCPAFPLRDRPADQRLRLLRVQRPLAHRLVGDHPVQGTEELTDVVDREAGDRLEDTVGERGPALLGFPAQDRDPGFVVRRRHIDDEAAGEAADQALVQRLDLGRRTSLVLADALRPAPVPTPRPLVAVEKRPLAVYARLTGGLA